MKQDQALQIICKLIDAAFAAGVVKDMNTAAMVTQAITTISVFIKTPPVNEKQEID